MRYVHLIVFILVTASVLLFTLQNLASVTVVFARMSATLPVALLTAVAYVLGMISGGSLWSLVRRSYQGAFTRA